MAALSRTSTGFNLWRIIRQTFLEFNHDECPRLAASLAYYAVFSLPGLLVVVVSLTGLIAGREEATQRATWFFREFMGERAAEQVGAMVAQTGQQGHGLGTSLIGFALLLVGATGVLAELQTALNRAWDVKPDPNESIRSFLLKRVLSLGLVIGMSLLLLASLVVSWFLAQLTAFAQTQAVEISPTLLRWIDQLASLAILTVLFAATYRFLPDVRLDWADVWFGAMLTALLFVIGKVLLWMYLAWADPSTAFGAAGSLALVLVWIYYSAMIYYLGAEFTHVLAKSRGKRVVPEQGAIKNHDKDTS